jgi:phosphatidylinositol dimannoside acyltransferase
VAAQRARRPDVGLTGYRLASFLAQRVPTFVADATASMIGVGMAQAMRDKKAMVERHQRRVDPTLDGVAVHRRVHAAFDSYARYWVETFRLPGLDRTEVAATFTIDGFDHIQRALAAGTGVILALPHMGGWEWAGRWITDQGIKMTVVVEPIEPPELFEWFRELRHTFGMNVVPLGPSAGAAVLSALRGNDVVCLLCDRDIQGGGVEVDFFGERTTLPPGPATLSLRTGAPLLPVGTYFTKTRDGHHAVVLPPLPLDRQGGLRADVARITQLLADELEGLIRRAPQQWHLFQPNWPSDPGYGL